RAEQHLLLPPEPAPLGPREPARTAGPGRRNTHARLVTGSGNGLTGERRRALRLRNTGRHGAVLRHSTAGGTESVREGRATPVGRLTLRRRRACVGHAVLLCRRPRRDGPVRVSGVAWVVGLALRFCVA